MTIPVIHKDITSVTSGIILHGTNAQKTYRSGVAGAIRNKWPAAYEAYMQGSSNLGSVSYCEVEKDL